MLGRSQVASASRDPAGNNRREVYFGEQDYTLYLTLLREFSGR